MLPKQTEIPVLIPCEGDSLVCIVHQPENACKVGVVIVVAGGPQYRVGAHRQFVTLSRFLARHGIASIRFDHRGTGDSTGELRGFMDMNADIRSATDTLLDHVPGIEKIILWGECESATASAFYGYTDTRVHGMFMVNPWIRTDAGRAKTILKHYYWHRLLDKTFWQKVFSGQFSLVNSVKSFTRIIKSVFMSSGSGNKPKVDLEENFVALPLPERLAKSCACFHGKMFVLTSGYDFIATEFKDYVRTSSSWQNLVASGQATFIDLPEADHTFSRLEWRNELFDHTINWIVDFKN